MQMPSIENLRAIAGTMARLIDDQERCPVCGKVLVGHQQCRACTILIGPGHEVKWADGDYCESCKEELRRREAKRR